jgi:cellulase
MPTISYTWLGRLTSIVYENGWAATNKGAGDNDYWGVKDLNTCCGKLDVKIPAELAAGDYLLRAEVIALHTAGSSGGAQFYMSCCRSSPTLADAILTIS